MAKNPGGYVGVEPRKSLKRDVDNLHMPEPEEDFGEEDEEVEEKD